MPELEQLEQLKTVTWDGNLISKTARDALVKKGLAVRENGWQVITPLGIQKLLELGLLKA